MATVGVRDYAALARDCVIRSRYVFRDGGFEDVIARKQPLRAEQRPSGLLAFRMTSTDVFRDPWQGLRPLRVTMSSHAYESDPESCGEILSLLASDHFSVDLGGDHQDEALRPLEFRCEQHEGPNWIIRRNSEPGRQFGRWIDDGLIEAIGASIAERGDVGADAARQLALEIFVHDSLENDLFLTTSSYVLERRNDGNVEAFSAKGMMTPREGRRLVHAFLRSRGDFRVDAHHVVDSTLFYSGLARGLLPNTVRAFRHCLAPTRRDSLEKAAYHLEGVITRVDQLVRAADALTVLSQREARYSAGNALVEEQLFLVQNSAVLVTGALDMLCWFVCAFEKATPHRNDVSWLALFGSWRKDPTWLRDLQDPTAISIRDAASAISALPTSVALAGEFRDCFQHRRPIQGGVADFRNNLGLPAVVASIIDVSTTLPEFQVNESTSGLIQREELQLLLPEVFHRGLLADVVDLIEALLGAVSWNSEAWWTDTPQEGVTLPPIDEIAVAQFDLPH